MDRYKARDAVTAEMERLGYYEGREDRDIPLKFSDRSKTPIEPVLSDQWFVAMGDRNGKPGLAQTAMDAVASGQVKFFPNRYAKTYLDWLGEKRDWCISRQLWWGHRIPVWNMPKGTKTDVGKIDQELGDLQRQYPDKVALQQFENLAPPSQGEHLVYLTPCSGRIQRSVGLIARRNWRTTIRRTP
jgi:valyl-tRNA synthetase